VGVGVGRQGPPGRVHQDDGDALLVVLRPPRAAHHLQHVGHGEVDVPGWGWGWG
jgi:hypothetical protein